MIALLAAVALAEPDYDACRAPGGDFAAMASGCAACATTPGREAFCADRARWLAVRTDPDGGYRGLTALARARDGRGAEAEIEAIEADPTVASAVRAECAAWLADRLEPARAAAMLAPWAQRSDLPPDVAGAVRRAAARSLAASGQTDAAAELIPANGVRPTEVEIAVRAMRERKIAAAIAAMVLAWAIACAAVGRRALPRPDGLVVLWALTAVCAVVALAWEPSVAAPVALALAGWTAIHLLSLSALSAGRGRIAVRLGAAAATAGTGWLALWVTGSLGWIR